MTFDYDLIVLGGGSAGITSAKLAKGLGKKVAIVEKDSLGGECTWTGCVPSKTLIKSSLVANYVGNLKKYGLFTKENITLDNSQVMHYIRSVILEVYKFERPESFIKEGIDIIFGEPTFIDNHHIAIDKKTISARSFVIATGSQPFVPPIEGIEHVSYLTNQNLFKLEQLPPSMIILGGGAIGAEMASALNYLGVSVTVIEMQERILPKEDEELVELLDNKFKKNGIKLLTGMKATKISQEHSTITVTYQDNDGNDNEVQAASLLIAVGRKPNIEGLHLERAGVAVEKKGIIVDATLKTTSNNIYACGDVVGPYLFSHMAFYQASIATRNALIPFFKKKVSYDNICWVTFTDPELATAGLTEMAARKKFGDNIMVYRYPYDKLDRAYTDGNREGLGKFICDNKGRLIGVHILGARAGELISEIQVGKTFNLKFEDFYQVIHPYPTYSELIWHSAKQRYIDTLRDNVILQLLQKFMKWKNTFK